jgi:hypothetical protein
LQTAKEDQRALILLTISRQNIDDIPEILEDCVEQGRLSSKIEKRGTQAGENAFYLHEDVLQSRGLALLLFDDAAGYAPAGVTGWISLIIIFARVNDECEPVRIIRTLALVECDRGVHDIHRKRSTLQARASSACRRRAGLPVPSCRVSCSLD